MGLKYELTDETWDYRECTLHRIKRLSDGELGGWIESENNLSQEGDCWVADEALVWGDARVYDDAQIYGDAMVLIGMVYGNAKVGGDAVVCEGDVHIYGNASVYGNANVCDNAHVYGNAKVFGDVMVCGRAKVYGNAEIYDDAVVRWDAQVYDDAKVYGNAVIDSGAEVYGNAKVYGNAEIDDDAQVYDNAEVYGNAKVGGDAKINGNTKIDGFIVIDDDVYKIDFDFIYKIDESDAFLVETEYDNLSDYFKESFQNDYKKDTVTIKTREEKLNILQLTKEEDNKFMFLVDIITPTTEFKHKSIMNTTEDFNNLLEQTIEMLYNSPELSKYADDLRNFM